MKRNTRLGEEDGEEDREEDGEVDGETDGDGEGEGTVPSKHSSAVGWRSGEHLPSDKTIFRSSQLNQPGQFARWRNHDKESDSSDLESDDDRLWL